ncbi:MAG: hypothetical protein ACI4D8_09340, partial [Wujia sp.]
TVEVEIHVGIESDTTSGEFKIDDWTGYPDGLPKPEGPFRVLEGDEYNAARNLANKTNTKIFTKIDLI